MKTPLFILRTSFKTPPNASVVQPLGYLIWIKVYITDEPRWVFQNVLASSSCPGFKTT